MVTQEHSLSSALNARTIGSGSQTMVLAHGYGGDQSIWDKVIPMLEKHYKVFVFDWPFSGAVKDPNLFDPLKYSSYDGFVDDLIALLDDNHITSCVFVGHSFSAMVGCLASLKRPNLFHSLILVAASPRYINDGEYKGGFETSNIEQLLQEVENNYEEWATNFSSAVVDKSDPESVAKFQKCLKRMRPEAALPLAKTVFYSDHRDILDKVTIPCTIIQASSDIVVPNSVTYYMQDKIKAKSTVHIVDTCGHFPQLTAHVQFVKAVLGLNNIQDDEHKVDL